MKKILKKIAMPRFLRDEEGLVTIEWVGIAAIASVAAIAVAGGIFQVVGTDAKEVPANLCGNAAGVAGVVATNTGTTGLASTDPCAAP